MPLYIKTPIRSSTNLSSSTCSKVPGRSPFRCPPDSDLVRSQNSIDQNANIGNVGYALTRNRISTNELNTEFDEDPNAPLFTQPVQNSSVICGCQSTSDGLTASSPFFDQGGSFQLQGKHKQVKMTENLSRNDLMSAIEKLGTSTDNLLKKLQLHPETLRRILEWQSTGNVPSTAPEPVKVERHDSSNRIKQAFPSISSYFPNPIEAKRPYKYQNSQECIPINADLGGNEKYEQPCMLDLRESLSDISLVPMVASTCQSIQSNEDTLESGLHEQNEPSESEISSTLGRRQYSFPLKSSINNPSLPILRYKMKKLMRQLSEMNAVADVMDIVLENLPPGTTLSQGNVKPGKKMPSSNRTMCDKSISLTGKPIFLHKMSSSPVLASSSNTEQIQGYSGRHLRSILKNTETGRRSLQRKVSSTPEKFQSAKSITTGNNSRVLRATSSLSSQPHLTKNNANAG